MTFMVAFIILTRCIIVQGNLEWKVFKKITEYGQDVTLICNVPNCCPKNAGWDKYTPQQRTIIIDVKTWRPTTKYDGNILTDGYTLDIRNLTKQDVNISYACVYGSSLGDQQYLLEENVFDYISTTHQHNPIDSRTFSAGDISTTQQNGQIGNQTFSSGTIAGIRIGVLAAALAILFMICFWKRRQERHSNIRHSNSIEDSNEDVPLINPYLEEPNDIHCIEGADAILTCKLRPNITAVKWLKNGKEITQLERCIMSTVDTQHTITLKNTIKSDSGYYYVHAGQFSKKIHLDITARPTTIRRVERNTYMDKIKSGVEVRRCVRIQVIGKDRVEKTSLVHRLLSLKDGEYDGKSTDKNDTDRKCKINRNDEKWFVGEGRCFKLDTDMMSSLELTRPRLMNTMNWELRYNFCYWPKFTRFVLSEGWMYKEFQDIPGIGTKYGKELRLHLKDYCSIPQLFDMFRYWWMNGVPYKFFDLLYWASNAINNNGNMHITRAYEAFRPKALVCLPCSIPNDVTVDDPVPMLAEE